MYGYDNYQKVKELIEKRRESAIREAEARDAELRLESREIREIDAELTGTGLLLFKTACAGGDLASIRERNTALNRGACSDVHKNRSLNIAVYCVHNSAASFTLCF